MSIPSIALVTSRLTEGEHISFTHSGLGMIQDNVQKIDTIYTSVGMIYTIVLDVEGDGILDWSYYDSPSPTLRPHHQIKTILDSMMNFRSTRTKNTETVLYAFHPN
jgi:hypothetical protein